MGIIYEEYIKAVDQRNIEVSDSMKSFGKNILKSLVIIDHQDKDNILKKIDSHIVSLKKDISVNKYALDANMIRGRKAKLKRTLRKLDEEATKLNLSLKKLEEEYTMFKQLKKEVENGKYDDIIK